MKYRDLVDPELKNHALKIPYNKVFIYCDKLTHGLFSSLTKTSPDVSKSTLPIKGYNGLDFHTDIYKPRETKEKLPALVCIQGGAFSYKAAPYHIRLAAIYAARAGCMVFFPDYHILPKHPWPAAWHDCLALYRYIGENAGTLGIDGEKIGVTGDSAGAFLAALICSKHEQESLIKPSFQMLVYPLTDYDPKRGSMRKNEGAPIWNLKNHERMMRYYFRDLQPSEIKDLMPMQQDLPKNIPDTYIETAEYDILHDEGIQYGNKLKAAGAKVEINETAGTFHGYDSALNSIIVQRNVDKRIAFLQKAFG